MNPMNTKPSLLLLALGFLPFQPVLSQTAIEPDDAAVKKRFYEAIPDLLNEKLKDSLNDPETYNKYLLEKLLCKTAADPYLQRANVKFLSLISESDNQNASLGIGWDYTGSWSGPSSDTESFDWDLNLKTKGNVAFDQDVNPSDFLTLSLGGSHAARFGGIYTPDDEIIALSHRAQREFVESGADSFEDSPLLQELINAMRKKTKAELYLESEIALGFETDQSFENSNFTAGFLTALDYKAWDDRHFAARANIFDYPSALFRWISGVDDSFTPNGASIPTLLIGLDRVEPLEADTVLRGGDDSGYFRAKAELTTKSLFAKVLDEYVFLEMNVRAFQELGASRAIRNAGDDNHLLYTIAFITNKGWYVSYSEGDLPFDQQSDRTFGVGFKYSFD
jgi:hypothetical protein